MNELSSLGLILMFALVAGHLTQAIRLPEVTGYILAGVALGPSALGWVSEENLQAIEVLSEVALGLILFSIGAVFERRMLMRAGSAILRITLLESLFAGVLVAGSIAALGQPWQVAVLLGAMAVATAPASTLMVLRECNGKGPVSDALLGVIAFNNILCLIAFSLVAATVDLDTAWRAGDPLLRSLHVALYPMVWQLLGSVALGFLMGLLLAGWGREVKEQGEILILLAGVILFCVGVARILDLSGMIASLALGATMINLSPASRTLFRALSGTDPPFYAIFFVIAGADLNLAHLGELGTLGLAYVVARVLGKVIGARVGAGQANLHPNVVRYLGPALLAQAGLAVGLMITAERRFPEHAETITAVVLSGVAIFEMLGPVSARLAIIRAGESQTRKVEAGSIWGLS